MTILDLKEDIIKKSLQHFYVFTGTELGIMNIYLEQMSKVANIPITRLDNVVSVLGKCRSRSLFGSTSGFYVVRGDTDFIKQDKVYSEIDSILSNNNYLVLLYDKIDSRLKFGKFFKNRIIEFEPLSKPILKKYVQRVCSLNDKLAEELCDIVSDSYDLAMLECDKVNQFAEAMNVSADVGMKELVMQRQIYQPETSDVFQFTDSVLSRNSKRAMSIYEILRANGVSSINILGTLYNSMKSVLLIQCCDSGDNISEVTGLDKGQIYFNKKYVGKYNTGKLVDTVKLLIKVIADIKNGVIEEEYSVPYIVIKTLGNA